MQRYLTNHVEPDRVAWAAFDPVRSCWLLTPAYKCDGPSGPLSQQDSARFSHVRSKANGQVR